MKKINIYIYRWTILLVFLASCDDGFDEMNINPVALTSVDPAFLLNTAIVESATGYNNLQYETIIVKQMINPFSGVGAAGQYNQDNRSVTSGNWTRHYRSTIKELTVVISQTQDDPERVNLYHMARIWRAYAFMVLTDSYGDVPYTEAGLGYLEGIVTPVYDTQEAVYNSILSELEAAAAALDASRSETSRDILYGGDITKWKQLGNSLLLRAAMRLSKVNPGSAADYVARAVAGGLMQSNEDNAVLRHSANFPNPIGNQLNGGQSGFFYLAEDFVDYLQENNDPRLASIAVRYVGAQSGVDHNETTADRSPEVQIGMPLGYDNTTVSEAVTADNLSSLYDYSQLDRTRMGGAQAPTFFVTYAQTQLLLAEAAARNWTQGNAANLYNSGIRAHMEQLADYGANTAIAESEVNAYLQAHPFVEGEALEQINTQYWVASFLNGPEAWANFRRSGYPELTPNPFPGSDLQTEEFIRRLTYPDAELNVNDDHVQQAIGRQGPDILDTRVWWDVE
ncbi:SusD/RagB family nutrient-binding outer membrane lipoprotein [Catalinimonas niigatensis]|uniref:SusD/RagB family nutrient-binding outer membrane lipoprotein n=1 Tax=Catalinimonas niigatensis TaxID=1397264 RepID=UPI00266679FC|nr:SusD/RagB family nutrient-binding outer membrane lipoprotein [Catalinimonas niigatensis]WPP51475.1 SusD/RagB family nutrient-binding outer membrane lipoprotein [Catalinimonas niigatensis]